MAKIPVSENYGRTQESNGQFIEIGKLLGKTNYVVNRIYLNFSRIITLFNFIGIAYLVAKDNTLYLLAIPIVIIIGITFTYIDIKFIAPNELAYEWGLNKEYQKLKQKIDKLNEVKNDK